VSVLYDTIGRSYSATRAEEPAIRRALHAALGDARTVLNVGAGAGSYEPRDRAVTALEPSPVMRAQRPPGAAPCLDASAEALPFPDGAFDAGMAVLSDHHWRDRVAGIRELRRVARRVVLFQWDPAWRDAFWLSAQYLPSFARLADPAYGAALAALAPYEETPVPIPHDCRDGFLMAYWRRPAAYLDPLVRANISVFAQLPAAAVAEMVRGLAHDLATGAWAARNGHLLGLDALDLGYRVLVHDAR
jgi:SAM-dependent methyltransferase